MSLLDIINQVGGQQAVNGMAARVGLTPEQVNAAITALAPSIARGMSNHAQQGGDLGAILNAVTARVGDPNAVDQGNAVLGQIFGSRDVSRSVTDHVSRQTGISPEQLRALLPLLAGLAASALASRQQSGGIPAPPAGASPAPGNAGLAGAGLGLLVNMLDRDGDGSPLNDILRMGGGLFGRNGSPDQALQGKLNAQAPQPSLLSGSGPLGRSETVARSNDMSGKPGGDEGYPEKGGGEGGGYEKGGGKPSGGEEGGWGEKGGGGEGGSFEKGGGKPGADEGGWGEKGGGGGEGGYEKGGGKPGADEGGWGEKGGGEGGYEKGGGGKP